MKAGHSAQALRTEAAQGVGTKDWLRRRGSEDDLPAMQSSHAAVDHETEGRRQLLQAINDLVAGRSHESFDQAPRRADKRFALNRVVQIGSPTRHEPFVPVEEAYGLDISYTGIGLVTRRPYPAGVALPLRLEVPGVGECVVTARVAFCNRLMPDLCRVGTTFEFPSCA